MAAVDEESRGIQNGISLKQQSHANLDAGAVFVLESKGNWVHAGYHLTTSIAAPALLSLPFAFAALGWAAGTVCLAVGAAVTFYSYNLLSKVLEYLELQGNRHLRFRDMARDILGMIASPSGTEMESFNGSTDPICGLFWYCCIIHTAWGAELQGNLWFCSQFVYLIYHPAGSMKLYEFVIIFGAVMLILSQMPSFHSLRHINLFSLILCFSYSACVVGGSIHAGRSKLDKEKDYSLTGSEASKVFGAFNAVAVIATTYGNGIIPEIQATLAPPVAGKMSKGLCICYTVVVSTFFSVAVSAYWAFGNKSSGNIFNNFAPAGEPALIPNWVLFTANMCVLLQLFAVTLVYSQPTFEVLEGKSADVSAGRFSLRNLIPRLFLRSSFVAIATLIAAMLPFFGDINGVIGAFGFMPLDFIFPAIFYNLTFRPSKKSSIFWINTSIALIFSILGVLGCISAIRQISLDAKNYKLFANV